VGAEGENRTPDTAVACPDDRTGFLRVAAHAAHAVLAYSGWTRRVTVQRLPRGRPAPGLVATIKDGVLLAFDRRRERAGLFVGK
jgi:hypothetical protein